jgi:hypothetical protein
LAAVWAPVFMPSAFMPFFIAFLAVVLFFMGRPSAEAPLQKHGRTF